MPKIKAVLTVEFEADSSDQETIDLALDQVLIIQPSCKILSKRTAEIDGEVVNQKSPFSLEDSQSGPRHTSSVHPSGILSNSYRPEYVDRGRDRRIDSYRPGSSDDRSSFRRIDSYKPRDYASSDSGEVDSDGHRGNYPRDQVDHRAPENGDVRSSGLLGLGTRYDALIDSMVFGPHYSHPRPDSRSCRLDHYSPQPRPDRSASPYRGLRRSERIRAAPMKETVRHSERSKESGSDPTRRASFDEAHESGPGEWKQQRGDGKQVGLEPDSLEALAPKMVTKDMANSKFERQQERHGITEALRLKNLRSTNKIQKARSRLDRARWREEDDKPRSKMDAIIDQITSFDFSTSNPHAADAATSHPPVETRKKRGAGGKKATRARSRMRASDAEDGDHIMEVVTHSGENDTADRSLPLAPSHGGAAS